MSEVEGNFIRLSDSTFLSQGAGDVNPAYLVAHTALWFLRSGGKITLPEGYDRHTLRRLRNDLQNGAAMVDSKRAAALSHIGKELLSKQYELEPFETDAIRHLIATVESL